MDVLAPKLSYLQIMRLAEGQNLCLTPVSTQNTDTYIFIYLGVIFFGRFGGCGIFVCVVFKML